MKCNLETFLNFFSFLYLGSTVAQRWVHLPLELVDTGIIPMRRQRNFGVQRYRELSQAYAREFRCSDPRHRQGNVSIQQFHWCHMQINPMRRQGNFGVRRYRDLSQAYAREFWCSDPRHRQGNVGIQHFHSCHLQT